MNDFWADALVARRADGKPTARAGTGLRWMARYVDDEGRERTRSFGRKVDAQSWLDEQTASRNGLGARFIPVTVHNH